MDTKKIAYGGIFAALAILMGYVEAMLPLPFPTGVKLALYVMGEKEAFGISLLRVFLSALLFKGFLSFWYSCAGALLSFFVMMAAKKSRHLSIYGVSMLGGVAHNMGQMCVAALLLGRSVVLFLAPILMVCGVATGLGIGLISHYCTQYVKKHYP